MADGAVLRAPFPYFGGKRRAAGLVWGALGRVNTYVEPFCGSAAVLLARPAAQQLRLGVG
jgi:site-specific DNA-adenine methylase